MKNKYVKYSLLSVLGCLEFILAFLVCYISYMIFCLLIPVNSDYVYSEDEIQFYVISNGVHTDICLPVETVYHDWKMYVPVHPYSGVSDSPVYISIGWGDKGFYLDTPTWADLKFSTAVNAAFLSSETAMHIKYWDQTPDMNEDVMLCSMNVEEYKNLIEFILGSFEQSNKNIGYAPIIITGAGYTDSDNFYEANDTYNCLKTCNTWTNESLKICGVKTSIHALFEGGIMRWL